MLLIQLNDIKIWLKQQNGVSQILLGIFFTPSYQTIFFDGFFQNHIIIQTGSEYYSGDLNTGLV
jgi:hypothetical protein